MPPSYYSQPMAPWIPTEEYSMDTAHGLEDRSLPRDLASFTPTQLYSSHTMNVYPSLPTGAERTLAYAPFPMDLPSFPTSNGFPAGEPPNIERIDSGPQSEAEGVESDPEYIDSESEPEDHPLPADAAHWISMSPAQFDREYPGGNLFVIEELNLNLDSEEGAPYVELDGVRALNRIFIIFYAVEWALFPYAFTDTHHEIIWGVLADLLKDGKVWLWVDGDEEKCADLHGDTSSYPSLTKSLQYVKQKLSCSSLRLRKPRLPTWTSLWERVSKASFAKRVSAIIWATFTSVAVRETGWERGRADWTRCALRGEVWKLYYHVLGGLGARDLLVEGRHSHLEVAFKDNLRCHGHSCFTCLPEYLEEPLKFLLYLQSFLCSTPSGKDISMILFIISGSSCQQCAKLQELYMSSKDAHYTPPLSLVVLNALRWSLAIVTPVWLRILALVVSRGMISAAILSKLDDEIRLTHLGTDTFDFQYQPWVNRLPRSLRSSVVTCSESEWRQAELAVRRENQHQSVPTSRWDSMDIGFGVRITAIYLLMSEHSPQKLTPRKYWIDCCQRSVWDEMFDDAVYPAHISASVEAFCDATSESWDASTHTCCEFGWGVHSLKLRQCYAAAYLLLHPESQDVPLLEPLQRPVDCPWQWKRRFGCEMCPDCAECRKLPEAEPVVPLVLVVQISELRDTTPSVEGMDDIVRFLCLLFLFVPEYRIGTNICNCAPQSSGLCRTSNAFGIRSASWTTSFQRCYIAQAERPLCKTSCPVRYTYSVYQPRRTPASLV
ncbi:hypothetical protein BDZ89DRAFT_1060404 [Hymenopellis radicata]|nr:hypothetical protein BDZ89DRAFT_1060404 [Hymenopellis radicata]